MDDPLTAEDLELLATPSSEIVRRMEAEWSFDCEEFRSRIKNGERWQCLLMAHIYLEHVISKMLNDHIPFPDEISFSRMPFSQRLDLARALALLPADIVAAIRRMTKLRNKIAHNLLFVVSDSDVAGLKDCTPMHMRSAVLEGPNRSGEHIEFFELLEVIVIMSELFRQRHATERLLSRKSAIRLRTVLDRTPGALYVE